MAIWLPDIEERSGPKYLQIVEAMAKDIAVGRLAPGTRLPPHRELAYQLGVSANTTSRAYAEAVRRDRSSAATSTWLPPQLAGRCHRCEAQSS
ncbi:MULTISPECIES: GntR family transcriptional regulator [unclassified Roseitalea]|uniref:GntR family transcriptional regulator n=1 Tax=unclassified Roseitalea TaxID=2639107 RepID=UPI00273E1A63|nr:MULTISPECIES: GntR family transcriptional regulator [unclassified Roseitalea]